MGRTLPNAAAVREGRMTSPPAVPPRHDVPALGRATDVPSPRLNTTPVWPIQTVRQYLCCGCNAPMASTITLSQTGIPLGRRCCEPCHAEGESVLRAHFELLIAKYLERQR
jgi:hypothetical protein